MTETVTPTKRKTIRFDASLFPELTLNEYPETWNSVGLDQLGQGKEVEQFALFLVLVQPVDYRIDDTDVMLVKASSGILERVYGPCVFRKEDGLILKVGSNEFPIIIDGRDFVCDQLRGDLEVDPRSSSEYPVSYLRLSAQEPAVDFLVNVRLAEGYSASDVKNALRAGEQIWSYFLPQGTGGEGQPVIKMQELGEGEFPVKEIEEVKIKDGRQSWIIKLEDGRQVWARGKVSEMLQAGWNPNPGKPLSLAVADIKERNGKTYLNCAFRYRLAMSFPSSSQELDDSERNSIISEIDDLFKKDPQGKEKAKDWAKRRGYKSRADMPIEDLRLLHKYLCSRVNLHDIPF